ncbi:MAG: stage II sporulation protein M [Clostridia bacterium]|nr:stage II sporulation protein M [Clostridia bacterium]
MIKQKNIGLKNIIFEHIRNNIKEYFTITIVFIIGIILGVILINNLSLKEQEEISLYINNFINDVKENKTINTINLFKKTVINNITLALLIWFVSSTVIGIPIVYGIILFRGFCLGYTISSIVATVGTIKGILFSLFGALFQNILFVPAIFMLAVSGIKLYKSIMKDKRKENIKLEIIKFTLITIFIITILITSALIETYLSSNMLILYAQKI